MKKLWLALLRWILGPKWGAAVAGGQAAYEAESEKEQAAAVEARTAEVQQIQAGVEDQKEQAHAQVAKSSDPDAVVNEQLRELGLVDEQSAGEDTCATDAGDAPAPAGGKN